MDNFKVLPDELHSHATNLEELASRISDLANGDGTSLGADTFGFIGQFFATGAQEQAGEACNAINATGDATTNIAEAVRDCAKDYDETDRDNSGNLGGLQG